MYTESVYFTVRFDSIDHNYVSYAGVDNHHGA